MSTKNINEKKPAMIPLFVVERWQIHMLNPVYTDKLILV
jgi:hypothetical protein